VNQTAVDISATPNQANLGKTPQTEDPIEILAGTVYTSPALNNDFYDLWTSRPLSARQIAVFARNYGEFNRAFPEVLSVMISSTRNVHARTEYAKTLFSEMGYGVVEKAHSNLFDTWLLELGKRLGEPEALRWENIERDLDPLAETIALIEGEKRMYGSDNATGSGAQLALEWQAYTMLRKMYDGAVLYKPLWEVEDEFHEACEYFYAHIGAAEKEHKIESLNGARQFHVDSNSRLRIQNGFRSHLELFGSFWNAIAREMRRVV
jgi:pyrroloquinoline quinone (PQQ) biosynthesis protein C